MLSLDSSAPDLLSISTLDSSVAAAVATSTAHARVAQSELEQFLPLDLDRNGKDQQRRNDNSEMTQKIFETSDMTKRVNECPKDPSPRSDIVGNSKKGSRIGEMRRSQDAGKVSGLSSQSLRSPFLPLPLLPLLASF